MKFSSLSRYIIYTFSTLFTSIYESLDFLSSSTKNKKIIFNSIIGLYNTVLLSKHFNRMQQLLLAKKRIKAVLHSAYFREQIFKGGILRAEFLFITNEDTLFLTKFLQKVFQLFRSKYLPGIEKYITYCMHNKKISAVFSTKVEKSLNRKRSLVLKLFYNLPGHPNKSIDVQIPPLLHCNGFSFTYLAVIFGVRSLEWTS